MRFVFLASLMTACAVSPDAAEPTQPAAPDAGFVADSARPSTNVLASSFDQYCTRDDECAAVFEGNACEPCRCANAAIRRDALPKYRAEIGAFWSCHEPTECAADCQAVTGDSAICVANKCTLPSL